MTLWALRLSAAVTSHGWRFLLYLAINQLIKDISQCWNVFACALTSFGWIQIACGDELSVGLRLSISRPRKSTKIFTCYVLLALAGFKCSDITKLSQEIHQYLFVRDAWASGNEKSKVKSRKYVFSFSLSCTACACLFAYNLARFDKIIAALAS